MRFLSVADRELRAAARQKATYRARWITAAVFFLLLVWLLWALNGFNNSRAAPDIFRVFSILTFLFCLFVGTARTADCISAERRNGTLGLLFLTNLNSAEIVAGKLCSSALASVYGLMAIFPMLALPLLMGGITFPYFERTVLALLNGIVFSLAAGFLASALCIRQFTAIALGMGLTILVGGGLMLGAAVASSFATTRWLADPLAIFSPLYAVVAAEGGRAFGRPHYWHSIAAVGCMSLSWVGLAILVLARTWRDRARSARTRLWSAFRKQRTEPTRARSAALRRRLLEINPFFWLGGRDRVSSPVFMIITVALVSITVYVAAPYFGRVMRAGTYSPMVGHLFAWLWTGLIIYALVLYYAAMSASQRLAEDKQTGALELILSTPTTERTLSRGLWMAYARKMLFPAIVATLIHFYFVWLCLALAVVDPPGEIPLGATPGEIFWYAIRDQPLRGHVLDWQFGFLLRIALLILPLMFSAWVTLGWVGRWLGLRLKHPGFAPMSALVLLLVPPVLIFSLACYLADKFGFARLPERQFLPQMMWLTFGIGMGHCALLSAWAAAHLRKDLRSIVMSRYQPLPAWRWQLAPRALVRFALRTAAVAAAVFLLVTGYYGYQNYRSKRAWTTFQNAIKQKGDSLNLALRLPAPVSDDANFVRSPTFQMLLTNVETVKLSRRMVPSDLPVNAYGNTVLTTMEWIRQLPSPLDGHASWIVQKFKRAAGATRKDDASAVLQGLVPHGPMLQEVAVAVLRQPGFQISTRPDANAVLHPHQQEITALERLHLLFQVRACAELSLGQKAEAADDLLTSLRLIHWARQIPDARSSFRVQVLLARSLQPLWEGLSEHAWNESQLATFQAELARFNLLADYTNAIQRVVLANIEIWRAIPDHPDEQISLPTWNGNNLDPSATQLLPRAWWFDICIQLHQAGQHAIESIDFPAGRVPGNLNWSDLNGLPLDQQSAALFQQMSWWGANPALLSFMQTARNQAIISCALERLRLTNSAYPATLDGLVPALLERIPNDAISGRPVIYQPLEDDTYILRGVGPNGIDDRKIKTSDDWLWTYSTNSPAAKK